jgi:hypothetical protein
MYTCELYKVTKHTGIGTKGSRCDARLQDFASKYEPKKQTKSILNVKGMDGSNLLPCEKSLLTTNQKS